ncbi:hypothetical protein EVAR_18884_1 [Eumeta japonica]|uniref:Uncharacterized protein n=1 Tax=Eumeta variegata TaxID=151549 RepID=A0A4C1V3A6_EUMVA|nr:hypothetical protein EVAR_18884_1 [Eumeta japonica]
MHFKKHSVFEVQIEYETLMYAGSTPIRQIFSLRNIFIRWNSNSQTHTKRHRHLEHSTLECESLSLFAFTVSPNHKESLSIFCFRNRCDLVYAGLRAYDAHRSR